MTTVMGIDAAAGEWLGVILGGGAYVEADLQPTRGRPPRTASRSRSRRHRHPHRVARREVPASRRGGTQVRGSRARRVGIQHVSERGAASRAARGGGHVARRLLGVGISQQAWALRERIFEVERAGGQTAASVRYTRRSRSGHSAAHRCATPSTRGAGSTSVGPCCCRLASCCPTICRAGIVPPPTTSSMRRSPRGPPFVSPRVAPRHCPRSRPPTRRSAASSTTESATVRTGHRRLNAPYGAPQPQRGRYATASTSMR